jgi:hypothetical protein
MGKLRNSSSVRLIHVPIPPRSAGESSPVKWKQNCDRIEGRRGSFNCVQLFSRFSRKGLLLRREGDGKRISIYFHRSAIEAIDKQELPFIRRPIRGGRTAGFIDCQLRFNVITIHS